MLLLLEQMLLLGLMKQVTPVEGGEGLAVVGLEMMQRTHVAAAAIPSSPQQRIAQSAQGV